MVGAPSTFPTDRGLVDRVDKSMSSPFFSLLLPLPAEAILSVPGCFFGMPLFGLPGSLLQALAGAVTQGAVTQGAVARPGGEWRAFGALFTALLCVWFAFLAQPANTPRSKQLAQVLYGKHTVVGAPLLAIFVMRALELESAGCGHFFLLAWYVAISPVLVIKAITRRRRPLASSGNCLSPLHTQIPMCSQFVKRPIHNAQFTPPIHTPNSQLQFRPSCQRLDALFDLPHFTPPTFAPIVPIRHNPKYSPTLTLPAVFMLFSPICHTAPFLQLVTSMTSHAYSNAQRTRSAFRRPTPRARRYSKA